MTAFLFVRHGETVATKNRIFSGGKTNSLLTQEGLLTSRAFVKKLLDTDEIIDACITSCLERTKTFAYLYKEFFEGPVFFDPRLNEKDAGLFEGCHSDDFLSIGFEEKYINRWSTALPNGESHSVVFERVLESLAFWSEQFPTGRLLIGSHTDVIRSIQAIASKLPDRNLRLYSEKMNHLFETCPSDEDLTVPIPHFYTYECLFN